MSLGAFTNPASLLAEMARIGIESQMVIAMRSAGMLGMLPHAPGENFRMLQEKQEAAAEAMGAAIRAVSRFEAPDTVLAAALKPYRRRTKANARRLTRRLAK